MKQPCPLHAIEARSEPLHWKARTIDTLGKEMGETAVGASRSLIALGDRSGDSGAERGIPSRKREARKAL